MNLNQQSNGETWDWHKRLMNSFPPIVDCGVHYVDVMCQMTKAKPIKVHAIGAKLTTRSSSQQLRHAAGHLRRRLGRLVRGRLGADDERDRLLREGRHRPKGVGLDRHGRNGRRCESDDINAHTKTNQILWHHADMSKADERIDMSDEPTMTICASASSAILLKAIEEDIDLSDHMNDGVKSLKIVLAADRSIHEGQVVRLT